MSDGRDSRWSPSLTNVSTTSSSTRRSMMKLRVAPGDRCVSHALDDDHRHAEAERCVEKVVTAPSRKKSAARR